MASILDLGIANIFPILLTLLIVWIVVFSILKSTKLLGLDTSIQSLLAMLVAFTTLLFPQLHAIIAVTLPWFALMAVILVFIALLLTMLGGDASTITDFMKGSGGEAVRWIILSVAIVIFGSAVHLVFFSDVAQTIVPQPEGALPPATVEPAPESSSIGKTLFHPQVIGFVFIMLIAYFAVLLLAKG